LGITSIVTPAAILKTQAALLGEKTKGVLEAAVKTWTSAGNVYHEFVIVVPALDGYRYVLFRIHHPITLYPVFVDEQPNLSTGAWDLTSALNKAAGIPDEEALRDWLRTTLASDATKHIIANLYAQASGN
jgi:hypothetical protein